MNIFTFSLFLKIEIRKKNTNMLIGKLFLSYCFFYLIVIIQA